MNCIMSKMCKCNNCGEMFNETEVIGIINSEADDMYEMVPQTHGLCAKCADAVIDKLAAIGSKYYEVLVNNANTVKEEE